MSDWMFWASAAGIVVIAELFTGTFYLLMIAIGLIVGAAVAALGGPMSAQLIAAGLVAGVATMLLRRRRATQPATDVARDPNVNLDVGQPIAIAEWHGTRARTMYRGAMWDVELATGSTPDGSSYRITEVRGSRLIVANA